MATCSSTLAWRILRTEEPGRLWSLEQTQLRRLSRQCRYISVDVSPNSTHSPFPLLLVSVCLFPMPVSLLEHTFSVEIDGQIATTKIKI